MITRGKMMLTARTFLPIATITGRIFREGETFAFLNTAFSTRKANHSDGFFAKHSATKFTCTRAKNIEVWRQLQVTIGN